MTLVKFTAVHVETCEVAGFANVAVETVPTLHGLELPLTMDNTRP